MKKIILILSVLFIFSSCINDEVLNNDTDVSNKTDETNIEISEEYKNIEIGGTHSFRMLFVNVGKADSIIIEIDGLFYMIDTGTSESVPYTLAALDSLGVERIEYLFLTHPDRDHIGGYNYIRELYDIGRVYAPIVCQEMYAIENTVRDNELVKLNPGKVVSAGEGVYFEVLGPREYNQFDDNDNSLVLRLTVNGVTTIFAADMKYDEEKTLIDAVLDLSCDILKVGYHGRAEATSEDFLKKASPEYAVISTSQKDEKDTADESVINMLNSIGCETFITEDFDLGIMITVSENGEVKCENFQTSANALDVEITDVSKTNQTLTMINKTEDEIDISGWYIVSNRGGEIFAFPEGTIIKPGDDFILACKSYKGESDCVWDESKAWNETKSDKASLIDKFGNHVDSKKSK